MIFTCQILAGEVGDCPPGKVHEWQMEAEHRHEHLLREALRWIDCMSNGPGWFCDQRTAKGSTESDIYSTVGVLYIYHILCVYLHILCILYLHIVYYHVRP